MQPLTQEFRIVNGTANGADEAVLVVMADEFANDPDTPHGAIYHLVNRTATRLNRYAFNIVSTAFGADGTIYALGEWGEVRVFSDGAEAEEQIEAARGPLRCIQAVGNEVFVCGSDMQVFRRNGGAWEEISPTTEMRAEFPANHMEAIDGFSETEIYATGSSGIIWSWDGTDWSPIQMSTNATFHAICCGTSGVVYAAGQSGLITSGRGEAFELVDLGVRLNDLWGVADYNSQVFLAGFQMLAKLEDGELDLVGDAMTMSLFFYDLSSVDGVLWSFGMKSVLRFDGVGWDRITDVTVV